MAKQPKPPSADAHRHAIKVKALIGRLHDMAMGKLFMTTDQIKSADILLKKALPDLSHVDMKHGGRVDHRLVITEDDAKL